MSGSPPSPSTSEAQSIAYLRSPQAIRDRCYQLFQRAQQDQLAHFRCDMGQLERTAEYVLQVMHQNYPDLQVPFHSRWRHFDAGGISRQAQLNRALAGLSPLEIARTKWDLAIVSVLLDAGAGDRWRYTEPGTDQVFSRSEGLAIASFHTFCQGLFSSDRRQPFQADANGLQHLTESTLATAFQVSQDNPLVGLAGRVALMQRLGTVVAAQPDLFGDTCPRPGYLVDYLLQRANHNQLSACQVLQVVLEGFADIWAGRIAIAGVNLGDVWRHSALAGDAPGSDLVPFHKLSQWLTYSLLEPLQELGLQIIELDELTGLAEYRNGGLCVDLGLLQPKHGGVMGDRHQPSSEVIVEWRALTIVLLDRIADAIRHTLGMTTLELPLVKVLEGGTWAAGRKIATERRPGGIPPIQIESDGTVF